MILSGPPAPKARTRTLVEAFSAAGREESGVTFVDLDEKEVFLPWGRS